MTDFKAVAAGKAKAAAQGIREILSGERAEFSLEYSYNSPAETRWFRMRAAALRFGRSEGVLVMHTDVTERKLSEEILQRDAYISPNCRMRWSVAMPKAALSIGTPPPNEYLVGRRRKFWGGILLFVFHQKSIHKSDS
ncbi:MAG: PAS domain-containing protein [Limisphaerales bacterium]